MKERKKVCVVVLGDIGRSPRMQYHSISLLEDNHVVDMIGYFGTRPTDELTSKPLLSYHYMTPYPNLYLPRIINYALKTLWQMISLFICFVFVRRPDYLIVQNPPAVPTLIACYVYCRIARAKLVIDWHNYAHTIMAMSLNSKHILVRMTQKVERYVGQRADFNFCVTKAMKDDLMNNWGIKATTLYDRPPEMFRTVSLDEKHNLFLKLGRDYKEFVGAKGTQFTTLDDDGVVVEKDQRPGLLISSTSWTEDEDFSILLKALADYETSCNGGNVKKLPKLLCVITGKGPMKDYYTNKITEANWKNVSVITPWLEADDYPKLLAAADLGVCLHTSSSGLDLPMKVVDMFGCGLPVCAVNFKCLSELVEHEKNGFVFNSTEELSAQIQDWFENFPNNETQQDKSKRIKDALKEFQNLRWRENWNLVVAPIINQYT